MNARDLEQQHLARCIAMANASDACARDQREANVARIAAMVMQSRQPAEAARWMQSSERYFATHPKERLPVAEVLRRGWLTSLPRWRDMLSAQLRHR